MEVMISLERPVKNPFIQDRITFLKNSRRNRWKVSAMGFEDFDVYVLYVQCGILKVSHENRNVMCGNVYYIHNFYIDYFLSFSIKGMFPVPELLLISVSELLYVTFLLC